MSVQNSLVKNEAVEMNTMSSFLTQNIVKKKINDILGGERGTRFIAAVSSAVMTNQDLQKCSQGSILNAALLGESLNLSPSPQLGQYYLVPFNDTKKGYKVAQFQIGYKGYIQLAIRSGYYKKLNVLSIKKGELVKYNPLEEEIEVNLIEDDEVRENTDTIGYFAMFEYANGFKKTLYWSKEKMESHAIKYSPAYRAKKGYTFWEKDFDGMAWKTMLRQLISKWGIMSIEMQTAYNTDMSLVQDNMQPKYIDNDENIILEPETKQPEIKQEELPKKIKNEEVQNHDNYDNNEDYDPFK